MAAVEEVTEEVELACSPYKTVPQSMIDDVLAVCPEVNPKDVAKDLVITGNPTRTINRILDGQFPAAVSIDTENMPSDLSCMDRANSKGGLLPSKNLATINTATAKMDVHSSSDTENYTHSDDDDVMLLHEERKSLFSALKKRLHAKESNGNCTEKPEIQTHSGASYCKQRKSRTAKRATKRTSTINDTSSSSSDEINACPPLSLNKKSNLAEDCMLAEPHVKQNYRSIYKNTNRDTDYVEGSSMPEATCKFVDSPQPDHDTDNCSESDNFPCIFPSGCHQSELSRVSQSNTPNLSSGSCVDSQDISEIPIKRKKRTAEEVLTQRNEALKKKQAKERERQAKKEAKDKEKQARLLAREQLKTQRDKEKLLKKADSMNQNNNRLDGCIKQIVVCIDPDVLPSGQLTEESILLQKLELLGAGCKLESQRLPGSITWRRAVVEHEVADTLQISAKTTFVDENCAILQLTAVKFVEMVFYFREEMQNPCNSVISDGETLSVFCERTLETYTGKVLTLVIMGLEKYFRDVKLTQQRQFRSAVLGPNSSDTDKPSGKGRKKANKGSEPSVMVSRVDVEEALVDLQLKQPNCRVHMCETEEEFAEMLSMFTKAVAEAPFKKKQPEAFSFCVEGGEKASVKVSKEGEGLKKVWLQHFQQFRNVSADMAAAIVAVYPSPQSLLQAYKRCGRQGEAANLLQDILVRRGAGVLATSRRIGPELSRRVHMLLTSEDGDLPLK